MSNELNIEKKILELNGFSEFNEMQKLALKNNWKEKNQVISAATSSGKTLLSELCALHSIINKHKKVIYTCPLKALASEHFNEFKRKYSKALNVRVALSTGDFDSSSKYLANYDLIFCTTEKVDSLIRHNASWLQNIGLLIVDEVHELDSNRGATLEMVIAKLAAVNPTLQIICLSATIPNSSEIADWLNAELCKSDFRPVKLNKGIFFNNEIKFVDGSFEKINDADCDDAIEALVHDTLHLKGKQCLISVNSRKRSSSLAKALSRTTAKALSEKEKHSLNLFSEKILSALESPTEQCNELADCVKKGIAFHNAGIMRPQLKLIEDAFRERKLKVLVATPTIFMGCNFPSFRVIVSSVYRYTELGMTPLSVREVNQALGRAGRTGLDTIGEGILIAKSELECNELFANFLLAKEEDVHSQLGFEPILRMHLLALIASRFVFDFASLKEFFSKTFYSFQFQDISQLMQKLESLVKELEEMQFIEVTDAQVNDARANNARVKAARVNDVQLKDAQFTATLLGKRVSELYLDPVSAFKMLQSLQKKLSVLGALFLLANTSEFLPYFSLPKKKENETLIALLEKKNELPIDVEREQFFDSQLNEKFNSSLLLQEWISEKSDEFLLQDFNVQPGILHSKLQIIDWLCYSAIELAGLQQLQENIPLLLKLRKRLKHGIKEELLELVELRGIGRIRARRLFNARIHSISDLKKTSLFDLSKVLGEKTALQVKQQLGLKETLSEEERKSIKKDSKQASLNSFSHYK